MSKNTKKSNPNIRITGYKDFLTDLSKLLESARRTVARTTNSVITATYWEIGRRIIEFEQHGHKRADYGKQLLEHLSKDLTAKFGRGFGPVNLSQMRKFYLSWQPDQIFQTLSEKSNGPSARKTTLTKLKTLQLSDINGHFPLPWSHYVKLMSVKNPLARSFYETEALRNGWSVRQLERQISSQYYERTSLSKNKASMLNKNTSAPSRDEIFLDEGIKDPFILEFLDLKDEYSENDLEDALIHQLETFLLELGSDFTFAGRQRRLRIGDEWYRIDLLFYHRRLRCLIIIELKLGKFTHADAGQMHMYLNYAKKHWTNPDENPPVGMILCTEKNSAVAHYALEGLPNKILAAEYRTTLPDEKIIATEIKRTRKALESYKS